MINNGIKTNKKQWFKDSNNIHVLYQCICGTKRKKALGKVRWAIVFCCLILKW